MMKTKCELSGVERFFDRSEVIVSKTDTKGRIIYANRVFQRVAGYNEAELIGAPHSVVRHPGMPRCVFKLLWLTLNQKREIFAYVVNKAKNGDHYWVFAHVTPSLDEQGNIVNFHSSRRVPERSATSQIEPIYQKLLGIEQSYKNRKDGTEAAFSAVVQMLGEQGIGYDEFIFSL
jgi:PAS domain S-box-containing protein